MQFILSDTLLAQQQLLVMREICCEFFIFQRNIVSAQWLRTAYVSVSSISDFWNGRHPHLYHQACSPSQWRRKQNSIGITESGNGGRRWRDRRPRTRRRGAKRRSAEGLRKGVVVPPQYGFWGLCPIKFLKFNLQICAFWWIFAPIFTVNLMEHVVSLDV